MSMSDSEKIKVSIPCYIPAGSAKEERLRKPVWVWKNEALGIKYPKDIAALGLDSSHLTLDNIEEYIDSKDAYADEVIEKVCKNTNRESLSKTFTLATLPSLGLKLQRALSKYPTRNQAFQVLIDALSSVHNKDKPEQYDLDELKVLYDLWNPIEPIAKAIEETFTEHELANLETTSERWVAMPRRDLLAEWRIVLPYIPLDKHTETYSIALSWFEDYIYMCRMDKRARKRYRFLAKMTRYHAQFKAELHDKHHFHSHSDLDSRSRSSSIDVSQFHQSSPYSCDFQRFEDIPEDFTLLTCLFDVINEFEELYEFEHADKPLSRMWFPEGVKEADKKAIARIERQLKRQEDAEKQKEKEKEKERETDRIIITKIEKKKKKSRAYGDPYSTDGSTISS